MGTATPERSATIGASNYNDVSAAMDRGRSQRAVERDPRPLERQMPFCRWGISLRKHRLLPPWSAKSALVRSAFDRARERLLVPCWSSDGALNIHTPSNVR